MNLLPKIDQCAMIAGTRGRGKTFLARWLLNQIDGRMCRFVFDLKGEDQLLLPGCIVAYDENTAYQNMGVRDVLYRPSSIESRSTDALDSMAQAIYDTGDIYTYIDEMGRFVDSTKPKSGLLDILSRGRKRSRNGQNIYSPLMWSTQRPAWIPLSAYSETDVFYILWLRLKEDRQKIASWTDESFLQNPSKPFGFRFLSPELDHSMEFGPLKVQMLLNRKAA